MYISAVFSQPETQHFLGANDGGCAPGAEETDPTVAQMLRVHRRLITGGNGRTVGAVGAREKELTQRPAGLCLLPATLRSPARRGGGSRGRAANQQFQLGFKYLQITTCRRG